MAKVSIIVPCYNMEKYLSRCLDSLVNQTLKDIEILCIDDKSSDNTLSILEKYASIDKRIKLIKLKKNSGVSVARNKGVALSKGEYIGFVDPDDYVDADFYDKLYNHAIISDADITVGNIQETHLDGSIIKFDNWLKSLKRDKLNFNYTLWCAIYKSDFIKSNKIECPVGVITSQDTVFVIQTSVLANKIEIVSDTYYRYIRIEDSLSSRYLSNEKIESKIKAAYLILDFLNSANISPTDYVKAWYPMFRFISFAAIERTTNKQSQQRLSKVAIDLYNKSKHKNLLNKNLGNFAGFFICADPIGLYEAIKLHTDTCQKVKYIKLFNLIPIIRIKRYDTYTKYSLFGIPVFGIHYGANQVAF